MSKQLLFLSLFILYGISTIQCQAYSWSWSSSSESKPSSIQSSSSKRKSYSLSSSSSSNSQPASSYSWYSSSSSVQQPGVKKSAQSSSRSSSSWSSSSSVQQPVVESSRASSSSVQQQSSVEQPVVEQIETVVVPVPKTAPVPDIFVNGYDLIQRIFILNTFDTYQADVIFRELVLYSKQLSQSRFSSSVLSGRWHGLYLFSLQRSNEIFREFDAKVSERVEWRSNQYTVLNTNAMRLMSSMLSTQNSSQNTVSHASVCTSNTEGIKALINKLTNILKWEHKIVNCQNCQKSVHWVRTMLNAGFAIMNLVAGCEEATYEQSDFNFETFAVELTQNIQYFYFRHDDKQVVFQENDNYRKPCTTNDCYRQPCIYNKCYQDTCQTQCYEQSCQTNSNCYYKK